MSDPAFETQTVEDRLRRYCGGVGLEAASVITALRAELAEARETIIAFAGPWATQYARDFGLPDGHLHPTHYDILAKAGARMDAFTRAALSQTKDTTNG